MQSLFVIRNLPGFHQQDSITPLYFQYVADKNSVRLQRCEIVPLNCSPDKKNLFLCMKSPSIKPYIIHRCNARQAKMKTMPTFPANSCRTDGILLYLWEQPLWCIINAWCDYRKHIVQPAFLSRISQTNKRPRTPRFPAGDTRHPRRGHTRCPSGINEALVGD